MAASMTSVRLPQELHEWATGYAKHRGVSRTDLLIEAVRSFKADCDRGVPEINAARLSQAGNNVAAARNVGVGACPSRLPGLGHIWAGVKASGDSRNPCVFCGASGREFFAAATAQRTGVFGGLAAPMESGTGKAEKAHPKGLSAAQEAAVSAIVADKKRRDAEAVESGTARPGQVSGVAAARRSK